MKHLIISLPILVFISCNKAPERNISKAFYYWKTVFNLSKDEYKSLDSLNINKLYVKFFDVTWDEIHRAVPVAQLKFESRIPLNTQLVPVVFITNETLKNSGTEEIPLLASRIFNKIMQINKHSGRSGINEIQIDCDWSFSTRDKYFRLLSEIKKQNTALIISATLRLHQIKYPEKTGVPPADKGLLMLYNMGSIQKYNTENSLYDLEEAAKYLENKQSYPLDLDIGLPVFSWGVVFRSKKFLGIINNLDRKLLNKMNFVKNTDIKNRFIVLDDRVFENFYLRQGDEIRVEEADIRALKASSKLAGHLLKSDITVSLYHLDTTVFNLYAFDEIKAIYNAFR